jgi:GT2 family glycosyltransferase
MVRRQITAFLRTLGFSRASTASPPFLAAEDIERLTQLGRTSKRVLCLDLSDRDEACVEILREGGCNLVAVPAGDFGNWLVRKGRLTLDDYDLIVVGNRAVPSTVSLLHGRVRDTTAIAASTIARSLARAAESAWETPDCHCDGLALHRTPPSVFIDPSSRERDGARSTSWFRRSGPLAVPTRMPSGRDWPRISIVTVTLNQAAFLEETLRSVLMQGYPNLEYIVLDGQSTDGTPDILARYARHLTFCRSEKDDGQADALNKAFALATGEILAWLNSDDRYLPETLIRVAMAFETYEADIVVGGCDLTRGRSETVHETHHSYFGIGSVVTLPLERLLDVDGSWLKGDFFWQPEVFWRRSVWERSGACLAKDLHYCMDYDLWVRMAAVNATIVHVPDTLAVFRFHQSQKTAGGDTLPYVPELRRLSDEYRARLRQGRSD